MMDLSGILSSINAITSQHAKTLESLKNEGVDVSVGMQALKDIQSTKNEIVEKLNEITAKQKDVTDN